MTCKPFCDGPFPHTHKTKKYNMLLGYNTIWYNYQCPLCGCCMSQEVAREALDGTLISVRDIETYQWLEVV